MPYIPITKKKIKYVDFKCFVSSLYSWENVLIPYIFILKYLFDTVKHFKNQDEQSIFVFNNRLICLWTDLIESNYSGLVLIHSCGL